MKTLLGLLALSFASLICGGCASTKTADDSTIPWSRPASWEGGAPGMGMGGGYGSIR